MHSKVALLCTCLVFCLEARDAAYTRSHISGCCLSVDARLVDNEDVLAIKIAASNQVAHPVREKALSY